MGAGPIVKLVLLVLVYFSVVSWAIIFLKFKTIHKAKKDSDAFLEYFWSKKRFDLIQQGLKEFAHSPLTVLFRDGYHELVRNQRQQEGLESSFGHTSSPQRISLRTRHRWLRRSAIPVDWV